jgi:very-short-patch-repair endonuclease
MTIVSVSGAPDPDWYLDNVLVYAEPGRSRLAEPGPAARWQDWWQQQAAGLDGPAAEQGFVLATAQLPLAGATRQTAQIAVRRGRWSAAGYGAIAPVDIRDAQSHVVARRQHALACAAAVLRRPDHVVSGRSAAILHGLPTYTIPPRPELTAPSRGLGRRGPAQVYGASLTAEQVTRWFGVPVIGTARSLVDLGRHDRRDAIMAVDAALREALVGQVEVADQLARARGWPGVRQAREVLALASPLAESPLESLARLVLHDDGFPAPRLQVQILGTPYRVDLLWPEARLILEIDGLEKYSADEYRREYRREKRREQRLRKLGYRIERITWDDIVQRWPETRAWLRVALHLPAGAA